MTSSKNEYLDLCANNDSIPIFAQPWWLNATAGPGGWDVVLAKKKGAILATMPYAIRKNRGLSILCQPALTPALGPWLKESNEKYTKKLALQKDLMTELIENLPPFHHFDQNWNSSLTNWLPFFWAGFHQTTRYTYVLPDLRELEGVWSGIQSNIKGDIKKATERFHLKITLTDDLDQFLDLNALVFRRQGMNVPYSRDYVRKIDSACASRKQRAIFIATDRDGRNHAGVYLVWDKNSAYYLMGGGDPELRSSGGTSLCMWEAIKFASEKTIRFDFEGSMLEPVERFFRAFGAVQIPYYRISKTPSRILKTALFLRTLKRHP